MTRTDGGDDATRRSTGTGAVDSKADSDADVLLELPESLRPELRSPLGPIREDVSGVPADASIVAVGDIVAYNLTEAGRQPSVAVVDRRTQREAVDPAVESAILEGDRRQVAVDNPAGTITAPLVAALVDAIADSDPVLIVVDGEEDLAVLPALVAAADGTAVLYGQPDDGMVQVTVDDSARQTARDLLSRMDGETDRLWALLEG